MPGIVIGGSLLKLRTVEELGAGKGCTVIASIGKVDFRLATRTVDYRHKSQWYNLFSDISVCKESWVSIHTSMLESRRALVRVRFILRYVMAYLHNRLRASVGQDSQNLGQRNFDLAHRLE